MLFYAISVTELLRLTFRLFTVYLLTYIVADKHFEVSRDMQCCYLTFIHV